jgi:hypothetical protein
MLKINLQYNGKVITAISPIEIIASDFNEDPNQFWSWNEESGHIISEVKNCYVGFQI